MQILEPADRVVERLRAHAHSHRVRISLFIEDAEAFGQPLLRDGERVPRELEAVCRFGPLFGDRLRSRVEADARVLTPTTTRVRCRGGVRHRIRIRFTNH